MTVSDGKVLQDLKELVEGCRNLAEKAVPLDPLVEIAFSLKEDVTNRGHRFSIVINRNSGGSPESDYVIEDEVSLSFKPDGSLDVIFTLEMMEQERQSLKEINRKDWEELLKKIEDFCCRSVPKMDWD